MILIYYVIHVNNNTKFSLELSLYLSFMLHLLLLAFLSNICNFTEVWNLVDVSLSVAVVDNLV